MSIQNKIHAIMIQNQWNLGIAESCTGGLISSLITAVEGVSEWFSGSLVTYSNQSKICLLGIPPSDIDSYGAVSSTIVLMMASAVRKILKTNFGLAITGNAGPSSLPMSHSGDAYIAVSSHKGTCYKKIHFHGPRLLAQDFFAKNALMFLFERLNDMSIDQ